MRTSRVVGVVASLALASTTLLTAPSAVAEEPPVSPFNQRSAKEPTATGSLTAKAARNAARRTTVGDPLPMPSSYPTQPDLRVFPEAETDASDSGNLVRFDDIAPTLNALMDSSDRVSTQVVGQSTQGRDLYLVTVTAPESRSETRRQTAWREKIKSEPRAAARDRRLERDYKTPLWISANIHGNEWEGTDAALQYIEELATAPWSEVKSLLSEHRLYFSLALNPDGRTIGQRATALNLDGNRDMITNTTPESTSFIRTAQAVQALYAADFHGYTSVLQIEPCGPPHGDDYEYDLFIPHAYAAALQVEKDVVGAAIPGNTYYDVTTGRVVPEVTGPENAHIKIPYRDTPSGWDDFPPVFTAQYAAFSGSVTATVELPKSRPNGSSQTPASAVVNTAVALKTMQSLVDYVGTNDAAMLDDQIEFFRRADVGAPRTALTTENIADVPGPQEWKAEWDAADDQNAVSYPRAFVVPVGEGQRSLTDARTLVSRLQLHGIEVDRLARTARIDGTAYPAGSYVVDMHQPLRNLAHALLAPGTDISAKFPSMYDISAWSWGLLWGATVEPAGTTGEGRLPRTVPAAGAGAVDGDVPDRGSYLTFDLAGVNDFRALNALLEDGIAASQLADGSAVVGADKETYAAVEEVAEELDVDFAEASASEVAQLRTGAAKGLEDLTVGYTGSQDDLLSLTQLGFDDLVPLSAPTITATPAVLDDVDVLWLGSALTFNAGQSAGAAALQAYVDGGGSIVGRGAGAFDTARTAGLVTGTAVTGNRNGNGIVAVDTADDGVLAPYAQPYSFIYPATWFTGLGAGTTVEQSYATGNPLVAGHWRRGGDTGTNPDGPEDAAGQPAVVSAEAESGAKALVFGTSVFFRTHPTGGQSQAARGLFWAAPEGEGVAAPVATSTTLEVGRARPGSVELEVSVTADDPAAGTPRGVVQVREGRSLLGTARVRRDGTAALTLRGLRPGTHVLTASYTPKAGSGFDASASGPVTVQVKAGPRG
ncbi:M14 family metallopeptidase [Mumia sp.]|uniref:M14 family metallopeptidase n=1 Tax=Mumia sp. TaxID=1965300 RepID=UPI00260580CB|nr:M14 family metallopeptidase [Mumia sp.]MDD9349896.1 M14 family metallopeptidase [Mumia sp.]